MQVGGGPHAAILLLPGGVGDGEMVCLAVEATRYRVGVLDRGVIFAGPLATHKAKGDGGLAAAAIAADGDGDAVLLVHCGRVRSAVRSESTRVLLFLVGTVCKGQTSREWCTVSGELLLAGTRGGAGETRATGSYGGSKEGGCAAREMAN